jgi:hypothetical protein
MKLLTLRAVASLVVQRQYTRAANLIDKTLEDETGPAWQRFLGRLAVFLRDPYFTPFASILTVGNGKMPFLSFSGLPGDACPGAGTCLDFCYSFRSWRYPAAFVRQVQNLVLLRENQEAITADFDKYQDRLAWPGETMDFRLYVDGDFDSVETVEFWFDYLRHNSWLRGYGYSKSFFELLAYRGQIPNNYKLNISSGHNHTASTLKKVMALPCTRGRFIAIDLGRPVKSTDHANRDHQAELRQAHGSAAFTCPGQCGTCTPDGHACGSARFNNVDIIIAAH